MNNDVRSSNDNICGDELLFVWSLRLGVLFLPQAWHCANHKSPYTRLCWAPMSGNDINGAQLRCTMHPPCTLHAQDVMMASNAAQEDAAVISWRHCDVITAVTGVMKPLLIRKIIYSSINLKLFSRQHLIINKFWQLCNSTLIVENKWERNLFYPFYR